MANTYSLDLESGSSQYAYIADGSQTGLDLTPTLTIEAWVRLESSPSSGNQFIIAGKNDSTGSDDRQYYFGYRNDTGTYKLIANADQDGDTSTRDTYQATQTLTEGVWYHVAVTINVGNASATTFEFFVNGNSIGNGVALHSGNCTSIYNGAGPFTVGALNDPADAFWDGEIDEVRVWNDVRTGAEIRANMLEELSGNETGLVGYWKFNNDYTDETSNENDLTASGSPVFNSDVVSSMDETQNSVDLEAGSTQYLTITDGDQTGLDITGDMTMECWVKFESNSGSQFLISKGNYNDNTRSYYLIKRTSTDYIQILHSKDGSASNYVVNSWEWTPEVGTWYHIAAVIDVSQGTAANAHVLYIDGVDQGAPDATTSAGAWDAINDSTGKRFIIGAEDGVSNGESPFDGLIDDIRVWSDIRTAGEISYNYNRQLTGIEAGLVGYWQLNTDLLDQTSNNNDLAFNGALTFSTDTPTYIEYGASILYNLV